MGELMAVQKHFIVLAAAGLIALAAAPAQAVAIPVVNGSFETLAAVGFIGCGTGCSYSTDPIPGWINSGGTNGQFLPGSSSGNTTYFNYVPDGVAVAYSNGGSIVQTLAATAQAGVYTLLVDFGVRNDIGSPGSIKLTIGSTSIFATGVYPLAGTWATYSATYTVTAADAGAPITITLDTTGAQADFDDVRLDFIGVPEPASWALMIAGFGMIGAAARRRKPTVAA